MRLLYCQTLVGIPTSALKNTGKNMLAVFEPTLLSRKSRGSFHGGVVRRYICYHFHSCH